MNVFKITILTFITFLVLSLNVNANTFPIDSIGTEVIDGKIIILYRVESKETLYSIHNKYGVSVSEISALNPGADMGLSIGQILKIPTNLTPLVTEKNEVVEKPIEISSESSNEIKYHTVKPGETLYGVSRLYPCSVDEIKKWNNLSSNALSVGQKLKVTNNTSEVVETKSIETKEEKEVVITVEETKEVDNSEKSEVKATEPVKSEEVNTENTSTEIDLAETVSPTNISTDSTKKDTIPSTRTVDMGGYSKVYEKGYAELLPDTENDERYLAHHRTLPEGTILQVKNLDNGKSVFVRVVDTFEDDNPKVIIKLSAKAELRLGTKDSPKFITEISYIP